MILLVDIGNTRIKWAQFDIELSHLGSHEYQSENLSQQIETIWGGIAAPESVYIANVGTRDLEVCITSWVRQKWGCQTSFIKSSVSAAGVTNGYTSPTQLGVDRWLAIIAAHHLFHGDVCIFDCGTAMTMDVINADGFYHGGLIFPGLSLLRSSLTSNTIGCSNLLSQKLIINKQMVAKNTNDGIMLGSLYAVISIIKNQTLRLQQEFNLNPALVITGGDAPALIPYLSPNYQYAPALVLEGLSLLIKNNK
jgi:type III pantothenate kinase